MSLARPHDAALLLASSLLVVLTAAPRADGACNATCQRDLTRCMATQCAGVGREACRRRCKPAAIRTLAYDAVACEVDARGFTVPGTVGQALRVRRGDREPITVWETPPGEPIPDPAGLCRQYGESRLGPAVVTVGGVERLGVSPDGSGVVFEVTNETAVLNYGRGGYEEGMFFVRADGRGLRRLGPASRDPSFRTNPDPSHRFIFTVALATPIPFSPNGRRIAFTDRVDPLDKKTVQIFVLDLATGKPTQVTHLPSEPQPDGSFLTAYPSFIDDETVIFYTSTNPDGLNPKHFFTGFAVPIDGSNKLKPLPVLNPVAAPGGRVIPKFGVTQLPIGLLTLSMPGTPVNDDPGSNDPISEVFSFDGKNLLQLTNFHRIDTFSAFLDTSRTRAFFMASADPRKNENPDGHCQLFSIDTLGRGLRQLTHFNSRMDRGAGDLAFGVPGCFHEQCGISYGYYRGVFQDPVTKAVVFDSGCDPFGANPYGWQVFSLRPDGLGLRQLTDAAGLTTNPDGSFRVEKPGPFAYSAALH